MKKRFKSESNINISENPSDFRFAKNSDSNNVWI